MKIYPRLAVAGIVLSTALLGAGAAGAFQAAPANPVSNASSNQTAERLTTQMPTDARSFVEMAASSDMFEIESSKLAKARGVGGEVAKFADQMIADHTRTSAELKSLVARMNPSIALPTEMIGRHRTMLQTLTEAGHGNSNTRAYIDSQRAAHNEAVALYTAYAQSGDNAELRSFAQKTLPALRGHLDHIRSIESKR